MKSRMPERARTDPWEPQGSNPLGPPGPELSSGMDARASLMELLEGLHDPRCAKGKRHPLPALLSLAVVGMLIPRKRMFSGSIQQSRPWPIWILAVSFCSNDLSNRSWACSLPISSTPDLHTGQTQK